MEKLFSTGEVARLVAVNRQTVLEWLSKKIVLPARGATGTGTQNVLSETATFALFLGHTLRRQKLCPQQCAAAMTWIGGKGLERLKEDLAKDRCFMVLTGTVPAGRLFTRKEVFGKRMRTHLSIMVDESQPVVCANIGEAYKRFSAIAAELVEDRSPSIVN